MGEVGSGKSSLMSAVLGEMIKTNGTVNVVVSNEASISEYDDRYVHVHGSFIQYRLAVCV